MSKYESRSSIEYSGIEHGRSTGTRSISRGRIKWDVVVGRVEKAAEGRRGRAVGIGRGIMHDGVHGAHLIQQ